MSLTRTDSLNYFLTSSSEQREGTQDTVDTFANRIKRKLREEEAREAEGQKKSTERQSLMLKAMNSIRKSLAEATRIELDDRFSLDMDVTDHEGWPQIELLLVDSENPGNKDCALIASANDRLQLGTVQFMLRSGETLGKLQLCKENQFLNLNAISKKALRDFLDHTASVIILRKRSQEPKDTAPIALIEEEPIDTISSDLSGRDLFVEDVKFESENRVEGLVGPVIDI